MERNQKQLQRNRNQGIHPLLHFTAERYGPVYVFDDGGARSCCMEQLTRTHWEGFASGKALCENNVKIIKTSKP